MKSRQDLLRTSAIAAAAGLAVLTAGCGGDAATAGNDKPAQAAEFPAATVELGGGQKVTYKAGEKNRFVFFNFGSGFSYTAAIVKGAQARAAQLGVTLDVLDAQVNPQKQVQQMQDAIASGKYAGGFVLPIVSALLCDLGTKTAPQNNFMLVETNSPLCGLEKKEGEDTWAPGSLSFVSAGQEISDFKAWADYILQQNSGDQNVIALLGPEPSGISQNAIAALKQVEDAHPEFHVVDTVFTDFSTADALAKMQDALQAHPDTTVVASIYSELTKPTVTAAKQQGVSNIRIYDVGADSTVLPLIASGDVQMTYPYYPQTMGATAVQALFDARMGKTPITRFFAYSGHEVPAMQGDDKLLFITKDNLEDFQAADLSEY